MTSYLFQNPNTYHPKVLVKKSLLIYITNSMVGNEEPPPEALSSLLHCLIAGIAAGSASLCGKLLSSDTSLLYKGGWFAGLVLANIIMWVNYTSAMQGLRTVTATATTSTVNFIVSGIAGYVVFGEVLSLWWFSGLFVMVIGIALLVSDQSEGDLKVKVQ